MMRVRLPGLTRMFRLSVNWLDLRPAAVMSLRFAVVDNPIARPRIAAISINYIRENQPRPQHGTICRGYQVIL